MNCKRLEEMLPAYLEGDLAAEDGAEIERHLASCAGCRLMLAELESLESSLASLKESVPSWKEAEKRFDRRWGRERWRSFGRIFLTAPALGGLAMAAAGALLLTRSGEIASLLEPFGAALSSRSGTIGVVFMRLVDALAALDIVILSTLYGLLALGLMLASMRFAVRWGRR